MKVNVISNINFKDNKQIVPRSQQQQNKVNFEKEKMIAEKADSVESNPLTALGYKLYRTFRILSEHEYSPSGQNGSLNTIA